MDTSHGHLVQRPAANRHRTALSTSFALLLACAVLLPLLGHRPLTDWDEGIYAEISREMLATHTLQAWLIPHWNGHLWFEKPPFQMWLTAASLRLFGLNAFAARLPSAFAGVATVTLLHQWLQCRRNALTAFLSTALLLSAFGFQHIARVGETDALLTLFCSIAILGLADLLQDNARGWLLFFTGFALALMTKGAASITLPLSALVLTVLRPRHLLRHARVFTAGLVLFLAATVPWHLYVYAHFGRTFLHEYLGLHTLTRATTAIEGHHTQPWFYLWVLLVSAPPFALLYPFALTAPFRQFSGRANEIKPASSPAVADPAGTIHLIFQTLSVRSSTESSRTQNFPSHNAKRNGTAAPAFIHAEGPLPPSVTQYEVPPTTALISTEAETAASFPAAAEAAPNPLQAFAVFALAVLLLFSAAGTRLPHYIAPAYPALSALTAVLLAQWLQRHGPLTPRAALALTSTALTLYVAAALLTAKSRKALHNAQLSSGYTTPDNHESVALLQRIQHAAPGSLPSGPLLIWRRSPVVPITTAAFYAQRLAQQVTLTPPPSSLPKSLYFNDPQPLPQTLPNPRLILVDDSLIPQLPPELHLRPVARGTTQTLAIVTARP